LEANETNSSMLLAGDWHVTNGLPLRNGIMALTTNQTASWAKKIHDGNGNIAITDGSVQQLTSARLNDTLLHTGVATNLLVFP